MSDLIYDDSNELIEDIETFEDEPSGYGEFSYLYDKLMSDVDYEKRAGYIDKLFDLFKANEKYSALTLLDLACGTGSLMTELIRLGYDLIGVDCSPDMLSVARDKFGSAFNEPYMEQNSLDGGDYSAPLLLCQDMREFDLYGSVDGVICTMDSINHLCDIEYVDKTFSRVEFFLNPGGLFIFDVNTRHKHENVLGNNVFVEDRGDLYLIWNNEFDPMSGIVHIDLDIFARAKNENNYYRTSEYIAERAYSVEELKKIIQKNHLELLGVFDDLTFENLSDDIKSANGKERLTFVVKKP